MAYIGSCLAHGTYVNTCAECASEDLARKVVQKIKGGIDPDVALRIVLDESRAEKRQREWDESKKNMEEHLKGLARSRWIEDNIPDNLKTSGTTYC